MAEDKTFYITTPIYYVNGVPHVGSATTTLLCDALARHHRLRGEPTFFLTGTDENAPKVAEAAAKAGRTTQDFVDEVSQRYRECWAFLNISNDDFIRTTEPRHKAVVEEVFRRLLATGDIYAGTYEGWYSVSDETFLRDSEVADGRSLETGAAVERVTENVYYFRLSAFGERLLRHIEANPTFLQPDTRRNEVLAFIGEGLRDVAITRRNAGWGIPVPGDPSQVIYVWFDACINYLTETGWPGDPKWDTLWPADVHLVGKEIYTRFHATLWPAMLLALGLPLPRHVLGHGWWLIEGEKGSKSKGNIPTPQEVVAELVARSGAAEGAAVDALRYYLIRDISFTSDAEFSLTNLIEKRYNPELCNKLGNLLNRTVKMLTQYSEGLVPDAAAQTADSALATAAREAFQDVEREMLALDPGRALETIKRLTDAGNEWIDSTAPWTRHKEGDTPAVHASLYAALESLRIISVLLTPFLPYTADAIRAQLGLTDTAPAWDDAARWGLLPAGTRTGDPQPIFPRIDTKLGKTNQLQEPKKTVTEPVTTPPAASPAGAPATDNTITIDDFLKVELRIAEIKAAQRVEGATKLLHLTINVGEESDRSLVAGIAESYAPEDLPGRKIVVVANLAPRKLRGVMSQGMLLAATDADGKAILLAPDKPEIAAGAKVK